MFRIILKFTAWINPFYLFLKRKEGRPRSDYSLLVLNFSATGALFFIFAPVKYYLNSTQANSLSYWHIAQADEQYLPEDLRSRIAQASIYAGFNDLFPGLLNYSLWSYVRIIGPSVVLLAGAKDMIERYYFAKYVVVAERLQIEKNKQLESTIDAVTKEIVDDVEESYVSSSATNEMLERIKSGFYNPLISGTLGSAHKLFASTNDEKIHGWSLQSQYRASFSRKNLLRGFFRFPNGRPNFPNLTNFTINIAAQLLYDLLRDDVKALSGNLEPCFASINTTNPWQNIRVSTIDSFSCAGDVVFPGSIWSVLVGQAIKKLGMPIGVLLTVQIFTFATSFVVQWLTKSNINKSDIIDETTVLISKDPEKGLGVDKVGDEEEDEYVELAEVKVFGLHE